MSLVDASVLLIAALFGFYGLASSIEYGIVFKILVNDQSVKRMFTPLWELTNVFLVFGFTALAILFNGSLKVLSSKLLPTLAIAITFLLVRACSVLGIFYIRVEQKTPAWLTWLFSLTTLAVPLLFSSVGIYLICGNYFWHSLLGVVLMLATILGLSSTGLLVIERRASPLKNLPGELVFAAWLLLLGCVLPLSVLHSANYLQTSPLLVLVVLAGLGLLLGLADYIKKLFIQTWHLAILLSLATPVVLAWSLRPYLLGGRLTLQYAWGAQTYGLAVVIGLAVMLPLIVFGLWIFSKLLSTPPND